MKIRVVRVKGALWRKVFVNETYFAYLYRIAPGFGRGMIKDHEWAINRAQGAIDQGFFFPPETYRTILLAIEAIKKAL